MYPFCQKHYPFLRFLCTRVRSQSCGEWSPPPGPALVIDEGLTLDCVKILERKKIWYFSPLLFVFVCWTLCKLGIVTIQVFLALVIATLTSCCCFNCLFFWMAIADVANSKHHQQLDEILIIFTRTIQEISKVVCKKTMSETRAFISILCCMKCAHYSTRMMRKQDCVKFRWCIAWQSFFENNLLISLM